VSVPGSDGNGGLSHDEDAGNYRRKANEAQVMMSKLMLTFIYGWFNGAETALLSFDETPYSRVPADHASANSRVVTLTHIDHVG
jgi:hypothetical protein